MTVTKSKFRIALAIAGLLHIIAFFLLPYAKLSGMGSLLGGFAGLAGMGDLMPESLTALGAVKIANKFGGGDGPILIVIFLLPVLVGLGIMESNLLEKKRFSYIPTILASVLCVTFYGMIQGIALADYEQIGYEPGIGGILMIVLCMVQVIVAAVGMKMDKGAVTVGSSVGRKDKKVKSAGKKDGKITGISGSAYAGAEIPLSNGIPMVIGRDPSTCSIVISEEKVSRTHCQVIYNLERDTYTVTDLSSNGTFSNGGDRLEKDRPTVLKPGSEIRIGDSGYIFRLG